MESLRIPYEVVEASHLDVLDTLDVLLLPWALALPDAAWSAILKFIRRGGRVLVEAEANSFSPLGFYRYPDERPFMQAIGVHDLGRRQVAMPYALTVEAGAAAFDLDLDDFVTPLVFTGKAHVLAVDANDQPLLVRKSVGKGAAFVLGSFLGMGYHKERRIGLEKLIAHVCTDAGVSADFDVDAGDGNHLLQWRSGASGKSRLLWIINGGAERSVTVTDRAGRFGAKTAAAELTSGKTVGLAKVDGKKCCQLTVPDGGFVVLKW
jgi:hypothetical protein